MAKPRKETHMTTKDLVAISFAVIVAGSLWELGRFIVDLIIVLIRSWLFHR